MKIRIGCETMLILFSLSFALGIAFLLFVAYLFLNHVDPVEITYQGDRAEVSVLQLGEYPCAVHAVKIYQKVDKKVLARVESLYQHSDVRKFYVNVGENGAIPDELKQSFVSKLADSPSCILKQNVDYCVIVYSENTNSTGCFRFDSFVQTDE